MIRDFHPDPDPDLDFFTHAGSRLKKGTGSGSATLDIISFVFPHIYVLLFVN